ncbi:MAG TPA: hypothetical protein VHP33_28060 [Polyangiaceae bacterium]|nr:hypothetical protein [Polyangiaceae bacterium]
MRGLKDGAAESQPDSQKLLWRRWVLVVVIVNAGCAERWRER